MYQATSFSGGAVPVLDSRDATGGAARVIDARQRLAALAATGLMDSETEQRFDRLTRMVARALDVPISLFSLVDDHRQFFKSAFGLSEPWASRRGSPLSHAFCRHVVARDAPFQVDDANTHPVVAENPAMLELGIAAYIGVPVRTAEGEVLGALCAVDVKPRVWTKEALATLEDFAELVEGEIDLRMEVLRRREAEGMLRLAAEATGLGLWWLDSLEGDVTCNARCREMLGSDSTGAIPREVWLCRIHEDDRVEVERRLKAAFDPAGDGHFQIECRVRRASGEVIWVHVAGQMESADAAKVHRAKRLVGVVRDITGAKKIEEALAHKEQRWRDILNAMPQMVWSALPDGRHDYFNDRWFEFTGMAREAVNDEARRVILHPDDAERGWASWQKALATGEPYDIEYRLRRHDGEYRWTLGRALPLRNEAGEIERWLGTSTDIHDRKVAEEQRELISRELSHRIKNIFAVVNSLVTLSARADPIARPFADAVRQRIEALARAHDYVQPRPLRDDRHGKSLQGLLESLLAAYQEDGRIRIELAGADHPAGIHAATALALLIHELATNAIKYGALSRPDGRVTMSCHRNDDTYCILWQERGGPPVESPATRKGFGSMMSDRAATAQLGATITHDWDRAGLTVRIAVPFERLLH